MKRFYRAYCRSAEQMSCSPWVFGVGLILLLVTVLGVGKIRQHESGAYHALAQAGAVTLTVIAALLIRWCARTVTAASGHHADPATLPEAAPARVLVPVPEPAVPSWPRRPAYRTPVPVPVPVSAEDAAAMAAEADALADEESGVVVSPAGVVYELTGPGES